MTEKIEETAGDNDDALPQPTDSASGEMGQDKDPDSQNLSVEDQVTKLETKVHNAYSLAVAATLVAMISVGASLVSIIGHTDNGSSIAIGSPAPERPSELPELTPVVPLLSLQGQTGGALSATGAIVIGEQSGDGSVIEVHSDYLCLGCNALEDLFTSELLAEANAGSGNAVLFSPVAFTAAEGEEPGQVGGVSSLAAGAAMCAAKYDGSDGFLRVNAALFDAADDGFTADQIEPIVVEAGLSEQGLLCVANDELQDAVSELSGMSFNRGMQGTPSVTIDNRIVQENLSDSDQLRQLLN